MLIERRECLDEKNAAKVAASFAEAVKASGKQALSR